MRSRGPLRPLAAWLVTGPLGHLAAGLADWSVLLWRYWSGRLVSGLRGAGGGSPRR